LYQDDLYQCNDWFDGTHMYILYWQNKYWNNLSIIGYEKMFRPEVWYILCCNEKKPRDFLKSILFILFFISFLDTKRKKEKMVEIEK